MVVDDSKVLKMKVKDYCDLKGISPKDYDFVGVSVFVDNTGDDLFGCLNKAYDVKGDYYPSDAVAKLSPENAEVILEFEYQFYKKKYASGIEQINSFSATAIALIPKKQEKKK